jgi:hypothetical protein
LIPAAYFANAPKTIALEIIPIAVIPVFEKALRKSLSILKSCGNFVDKNSSYGNVTPLHHNIQKEILVKIMLCSG